MYIDVIDFNCELYLWMFLMHDIILIYVIKVTQYMFLLRIFYIRLA